MQFNFSTIQWRILFSCAFLFLFSLSSSAQAPNTYNLCVKNIQQPSSSKLTFEVWLEWTGPNTAQFQSLQFGLDFNYAGMSNGGPAAMTGSYVSGSAVPAQPAPLNNPTVNINPVNNHFRQAAAVGVSNLAALNIPGSPGLNLGTYQIDNGGVPFTPNSTPNFVWYTGPVAGGYVITKVSCFINGSTLGTQATGTLCVSGNPILNPTASSSVISNGTGSAIICNGSSANIKVDITGGVAPYTVVYTNGTSNFTVTGYTSGTNIPVSPTSTTTYSLVSVTSANSNLGLGNTGTAIVTVNQATTSTIPVSACDTYTWPLNGQTYTTSGLHTVTTTNVAGCDSIVTLSLTINNSTIVTTPVTACNSYTWPLNGATYTASGNHSFVNTNAAGCPNTNYLVLTINNNTSSSVNDTTCGSYLWVLNGQTYTSSGNYTTVTTNGQGCTDTVTLHLTINTNTVTTTSQTACGSYTWPLNGVTYTSSGNYSYVTTTTFGCTNTNYLILTINPNSSNSTSASACNYYIWPLNGQTYTSSGVYAAYVTTPLGCIDTTFLNLTIVNPTNTQVNSSGCNAYTWAMNGQTYTNSGTYTYTSVNAVGCTDTITLSLTINANTVSTTPVTACGSYTWAVNGQTYTTGGNYTATTTNAAGCTETAYLVLTLNTNTTITYNQNACDNYTWSVNGQTYTSTGVYTATSTNAAGCIETSILNLVINYNTSITTNLNACNTYTWSTNGVTYTVSGVYTSTSVNAAGCTQTSILNLTIAQGLNTVTNINVFAAGSYTWALNSTTYTSSGVYTNIFTNANGCTETTIMNLTIWAIGIEETISSNGITLYPNPAHNQINLNLATFTNQDLQLKITDIIGKTTQFISINSKDPIYSLNLNAYAIGLYTIELSKGSTILFKGKMEKR